VVNEENLIKLRELMAAEFGEDDLRQLCRDLDLDFETLPGLGVFGKTRSIIESTRRRNQLPVLLARVRELRPAAYAAAASAYQSERRNAWIAGGSALVLGVGATVLWLLVPSSAVEPAPGGLAVRF